MHALGDTSSTTHLNSKLPAYDATEISATASSSNIVAAPMAEADEMAGQKKKAKDAKKKSLKRLWTWPSPIIYLYPRLDTSLGRCMLSFSERFNKLDGGGGAFCVNKQIRTYNILSLLQQIMNGVLYRRGIWFSQSTLIYIEWRLIINQDCWLSENSSSFSLDYQRRFWFFLLVFCSIYTFEV